MRTGLSLPSMLMCYGLPVTFLAAAPPLQTGPSTILLVDDHDVLYRPGTKRVLHSPQRHKANPVIPETKPWELAIGYCSVYRDSSTGRHQMWYQAYGGGRAKDPTRRLVVGYAESSDGVRWVKPDLGLYDFNDIKKTNIVLIGNGGKSVNYGAAVVVDPDESDQARRYKMAYWDFAKDQGKEYPGLCVAFSPDGIHWTKHPKAPLIKACYADVEQPPYGDDRDATPWVKPLSVSDVIDLMYDPKRESYVIYAKTWLDGPDGRMFWKRGVVRTESKDFVAWSKPQLMMAPDEGDAGQLHGGPAFFHGGVYFSLLQVLNFGGWDSGGDGNMPAELAISRDGIHWQRPFRTTPFLPVAGDASTFDAGCLWTNAMPVVLKDEIRFYYGAYAEWNSDLNEDASGIGLATLPRDRFAGVRPIETIGQITMKPMQLDGVKGITLNGDASDGAIRVELLDEDGYRVRGFSKDDAVVIRGDKLDHEVAWTGNTVAGLAPGRYMLRLYLEKAEVFAVSLRAK